MSENTKIEWADMTFNPWRGCSKVSPGCKFCYAERQAKRNPAVLGRWGAGRISVRGVESYLQLPHKWEKLAAQGRFVQCDVCGKREFRKAHPMLDACTDPTCLPMGSTSFVPVRPRVFCLSFGDWLDADVPLEWLVELLETIRMTPHLDWLLLTKRPGNFHVRMLEAALHAAGYRDGQKSDLPSAREMPGCEWIAHWTKPRFPADIPANVWVGTSVEDQIRADERIPALLEIPAKVRFLSCEPVLGPLNLPRVDFHCDLCGGTGMLARWPKGKCHHCAGRGKIPGISTDPQYGMPRTPMRFIDWVIAGGESESKEKARPFALEWALALKQQCTAAGVPFFLKQLGTNPYVENANLWDWPIDEDLVYTDLPPSLNCQAAAAAGVQLRHKKGGDFEEWPEQLLGCRHFPRA